MGVRSREGGDWPCGCGDQRVTAAVETRCGTGKGAHEGASRTWGGWGVGHQQCGPGRKTARRPASRLTRACDVLGWGYSPILLVGKRRHRGDVTCLSRQGQRRHRASPRRRLATAPSSAQLCREHVWRHEGPSWSARSPTARRERAPRTSTPHRDARLSEDGWRAGRERRPDARRGRHCPVGRLENACQSPGKTGGRRRGKGQGERGAAAHVTGCEVASPDCSSGLSLPTPGGPGGGAC